MARIYYLECFDDSVNYCICIAAQLRTERVRAERLRRLSRFAASMGGVLYVEVGVRDMLSKDKRRQSVASTAVLLLLLLHCLPCYIFQF